MAIRAQFVTAWGVAFESAAGQNQAGVFNRHFWTMMDCLHTILQQKETIFRNVFMTVSASFSTCLEKCDADNLKQPLFNLS
jgi:hypothetical protein